MATTTQRTYSFTLVLAGTGELTIEDGDALYAVIDDALLHSEGSTLYLDFDRKSESLETAFASARRDIERAGYAVARVEVEGR